MASQRKNWIISEIARSAQSNIENLDLKSHEEVIKRFERLEIDPFLGDIQKVEGKKKYIQGKKGEILILF